MVLLRYKRRRRGAQGGQEDRDVAGQVTNLVPDDPERLRAMVEVPEGKGQLDHGANFVQLELEFGHHPEVAASAPDGPEQVRVLLRRSPHDGAVRRHDLHRQEIVTAQARLAAQPAHPAAESQPGHAGVADESARCRQGMLLSRRIELRPPRATATARGPRGWVDADIAEGAQIDHDGVVSDTRTREVVTTAADSQVPSGGPREPDRGGHVIRRTDPGYRPRPPVDVAIPYALGADGVIVGVIRRYHPARKIAAECLQLASQQVTHLPLPQTAEPRRL